MPGYFSDMQAQQVVDQFEANAIPVTGLSYVKAKHPAFKTTRFPLAHLFTARRPDVRKLCQDALKTPETTVVSRWAVAYLDEHEIVVYLELEFQAPLACTFNLKFPTRKASTRYWLIHADRLRYLGITHERPGLAKGVGRTVQLGGTPLRELLIETLGVVETAQNWRWQ
jgi:hypothetical protein